MLCPFQKVFKQHILNGLTIILIEVLVVSIVDVPKQNVFKQNQTPHNWIVESGLALMSIISIVSSDRSSYSDSVLLDTYRYSQYIKGVSKRSDVL